MQEFFTSDLPARETFALEFLAHIEVDKEWLWKILWTDKAYFHLTECVNAQNCQIWETDNPLETQPVPLHPSNLSNGHIFLSIRVL